MSILNPNARTVQWEKTLEQWQSSGLTKAEWCRRTGTSKETFFYWQKKLNFFPSAKHNKVEFIELTDSPKTTSKTASGIVIEYSGATIQLMEEFHLETLINCFRALRSV